MEMEFGNQTGAKQEYNWAILGCGDIANGMVQAMQTMGRTVYAVGSRTHSHAVAFAEKYGIEKVYDHPDEMFSDGGADIIYIATPHNTHIEYLLKALNHGKHVLCEKSITLNSDELRRAVNIAAANKLVLAEAMTIYHMPIYKKLNEMISSGRLGKLKLIQMNFGSPKEYNMTNRFFNKNLAGGALLDIGVYALSFVRMFLSEAPCQITSQVQLAPSGVDEQASILLNNTKNEMAAVILSLTAKQPKRGTVAFENGYIEIFEYPRADKAVITYTEDGHSEVVEAGNTAKALCYEVQDMEKAVSGENTEMHLDDTMDVMNIMTALRNDWNLKYPEELK